MGNKEDIRSGLKDLLGKKPDAPKKDKKAGRMQDIEPETVSSRLGRKSRMNEMSTNEMRTSLVIDRTLYQQLCQIAVANNLTYKDVMNAAMRLYIDKYEKKHGPITVRESNISADELI